jgi:hypothetical protein
MATGKKKRWTRALWETLGIHADPDGTVYLTVEQGADALRELGPIVSMVLATQPEQVVRDWIDTLIGMHADKENFTSEFDLH